MVKALDLSSNGRMSAWVRTPPLVVFGKVMSVHICIVEKITTYVSYAHIHRCKSILRFSNIDNQETANLQVNCSRILPSKAMSNIQSKKSLETPSLFYIINELDINLPRRKELTTRVAEWLRRWT